MAAMEKSGTRAARAAQGVRPGFRPTSRIRPATNSTMQARQMPSGSRPGGLRGTCPWRGQSPLPASSHEAQNHGQYEPHVVVTRHRHACQQAYDEPENRVSDHLFLRGIRISHEVDWKKCDGW